MSIEQEIKKLKVEVIDKTESSFRVLKQIDDVGEHIAILIERERDEVVKISKKDYTKRIVVCYTKLGYLKTFYPI